MSKINKELAINIRADFCTRMRSIGRKRKEIEQLNFYLEASLNNINELAKRSTY